MHGLPLSAESWHGDGDEYSVEALGQIVLECSGCGEYVILLGPEEDWPRKHRDAFDCSGCAKTVTRTHFLDANGPHHQDTAKEKHPALRPWRLAQS